MEVAEQVSKRALSASMRALMRKTLFSDISIQMICDGAGVSRRNFYRHFPDKYTLLNWIYYVDFVANQEAHDDWVIWDCFEDICTAFYQDKDFYANELQVSVQISRASEIPAHIAAVRAEHPGICGRIDKPLIEPVLTSFSAVI